MKTRELKWANQDSNSTRDFREYAGILYWKDSKIYEDLEIELVDIEKRLFYGYWNKYYNRLYFKSKDLKGDIFFDYDLTMDGKPMQSNKSKAYSLITSAKKGDKFKLTAILTYDYYDWTDITDKSTFKYLYSIVRFIKIKPI